MGVHGITGASTALLKLLVLMGVPGIRGTLTALLFWDINYTRVYQIVSDLFYMFSELQCHNRYYTRITQSRNEFEASPMFATVGVQENSLSNTHFTYVVCIITVKSKTVRRSKTVPPADNPTWLQP